MSSATHQNRIAGVAVSLAARGLESLPIGFLGQWLEGRARGFPEARKQFDQH